MTRLVNDQEWAALKATARRHIGGAIARSALSAEPAAAADRPLAAASPHPLGTPEDRVLFELTKVWRKRVAPQPA
jgi:hypothetical protein